MTTQSFAQLFDDTEPSAPSLFAAAEEQARRAENDARRLRLCLEVVLSFCDGLDDNRPQFGDVTDTIRDLIRQAYAKGQTLDNRISA